MMENVVIYIHINTKHNTPDTHTGTNPHIHTHTANKSGELFPIAIYRSNNRIIVIFDWVFPINR